MENKLPTAHEAYETAKGISDNTRKEDLEAFRALVFTTVNDAIKAPAMTCSVRVAPKLTSTLNTVIDELRKAHYHANVVDRGRCFELQISWAHIANVNDGPHSL